MLWSRKATANVAISITAGDWDAQRPEDGPLHRQRQDDHDREAERDPHADRPAALGCEGERERARHDQLAVGEVHQPEHAEDEPDADRHQREDRAEPDRVHLHLQVDGVAEEVGQAAGDGHAHER